MTRLVFLAALPLLGMAQSPSAQPGPQSDPFRLCAERALAGYWGPLKPWQQQWYRLGLERGLTVQGRAKVTSFGPWENPRMSGGPFCWVGPVRIRLDAAHCAANPELPKGSIVWTPYGLRFVVDRGGWVRLGRPYTRPGETANLDYWSPRPLPTLRGAPYLVLRRGW